MRYFDAHNPNDWEPERIADIEALEGRLAAERMAHNRPSVTRGRKPGSNATFEFTPRGRGTDFDVPLRRLPKQKKRSHRRDSTRALTRRQDGA